MKTTTKKPIRLWCKGSAVIMVTLVALSGCGGGSGSNSNDQPPSADTTTVPDSSGSSGQSFTGFVQTLSPTDETSEPLVFKDSFVEPSVEDTADLTP